MTRRSEVGEAITQPRLSIGGRVGLIAAVAFALLPVYWLAATAFMPQKDVFATNRPLFPINPTLANFETFFHTASLIRDLGNSFIVSTGTAIVSVIVGGMMAYSLSKFRYGGRGALMVMFLLGQLVPGALLLISLYLLLASAGLLYTYVGLILSFTTFTLPLTVFLLKGIIDALPDELLEAAKVDGLGRFATMGRIVAPLVVPGLIAAAMFAFMRAWSDLLFALTLAGPDKQTLPAGLTETFITEGTGNWPALMAASLITSVPLAIIFVVLQRYFVSGLAAGAVKG
jgi:multiple sugar transport system permease protein